MFYLNISCFCISSHDAILSCKTLQIDLHLYKHRYGIQIAFIFFFQHFFAILYIVVEGFDRIYTQLSALLKYDLTIQFAYKFICGKNDNL